MAEAFLEYDVVDVFAAAPFAGNQLAVVHGADDLPDAALLAIAQEFGFSETTFPTPVDDGRYRVRIFTPGGEIPFAGHPTLGTASVLRDRGRLGEPAVVQECGAGEIQVTFLGDQVELTATPRDRVGPLGDAFAAQLLQAVGLELSDCDGEVWLAGTGLTFVHLPVHDEAVARAALPRRAVRELAELPETGDPLDGINLYAVRDRSGDGLDVHSRVFVPGLLGAEDPATGSAAAGLGIALHARGLLENDDRYRVSQGTEMGRPSVLHGRIDADTSVTRVHVAGAVHFIAQGHIRVP
ncbi:MAG TPA: PhzF family phenazine biosynthesis protein [Marmoricola sp.]|nr:PhzF family phenazine biosynthesis protein [Marmoricola sp.]